MSAQDKLDLLNNITCIQNKIDDKWPQLTNKQMVEIKQTLENLWGIVVPRSASDRRRS